MNPQYYVRTAPRQPDPRFAFSAFSIRPAQAELFDVAHVILLAEALDDSGATLVTNSEAPPLQEVRSEDESRAAPSSHQALLLMRRIMQQETALPVVRRLVEALRQANTVLYNEQRGARIIAGILVKNTLYLTCVGAMGAYVIRHEKVAVLLQAERTRTTYLGQTQHLQLDYQMPTAAALFAEAQTPHAYLITDRFLLTPGDSVIFCSSELPLATIKPALIYTRQPERLATYLTNTALRQTGQTPGVIALHWHVDRLMQTVKQVALVFFIFFCVTATMQSVVFVNQRLEQWLVQQRGNTPTRDLPPILYDTAVLDNSTTTATPGAQTSVQVDVDVNVDGLAAQGNHVADSAHPAALIPVVAPDILLHQSTPTAIQLASASIEQLPTEPVAELVRTTASDTPLTQAEQNTLAGAHLAQSSALPSGKVTGFGTAVDATGINPTPTLSPLLLLPIAATPTNTALPTATPMATPPQVPPTPTVLQSANTPAPPTATATSASTATPIVPPTTTAALPITTPPTEVASYQIQPALAAPVAADSVMLLAPPEQTSSRDLITFVWQGQTPLPAGQAYEVIVWRPGQTPLTDGLGIAPPSQTENLTAQLRGLYEAGIIQPGAYHWGVLQVTVAPYVRLALLSPAGSFTFAGPDQAPSCNPDRETC